MTETTDSWPAGATWVFQGTIAEDATAGTHVCTLTVIPGAGNEFQLMSARVIVGNTATAQAVKVSVTDGTNILTDFANESITSANSVRNYPNTANAGGASTQGAYIPHPVSGTMALVLSITTAAVSVTQTFAVACRIKGAMPTAVLNDTIGTSTNTVNTNKVF